MTRFKQKFISINLSKKSLLLILLMVPNHLY